MHRFGETSAEDLLKAVVAAGVFIVTAGLGGPVIMRLAISVGKSDSLVKDASANPEGPGRTCASSWAPPC